MIMTHTNIATYASLSSSKKKPVGSQCLQKLKYTWCDTILQNRSSYNWCAYLSWICTHVILS